ncbi:MAG: arsenate reductase ArsC [Lentisphaeraceae bacterium]|nr:arsenate reductase ArsC [Lentisphaeraceae bacterium]
MSKTKILFLCNGNSCRSKMAEAWTRELFPEFDVFSAGVEPHSVNKYAVRVMEEKNISLTVSTEQVENYSDKDLDYVITVCDRASRSCPVKFEGIRLLHRNFTGPSKIARTKETEEEKLECYRITRDEIHSFIKNLPAFLNGTLKACDSI